MFKTIRDLVCRDEVLTLASAFVLGSFIYSSVAALSSALVNYVVLPPLGLLLGRRSFPSLFINLTPDKLTPAGRPVNSIESAHYVGASIIAYGAFLTVLLQIIVMLFLISIIVRRLHLAKRRAQSPAETQVCPYCFSTVPALATRCAHCTSHLPSLQETSS